MPKRLDPQSGCLFPPLPQGKGPSERVLSGPLSPWNMSGVKAAPQKGRGTFFAQSLFSSPGPQTLDPRPFCLLLLLLLTACAPKPADDNPLPKINDFHPATQPILRGDPAQVVIHRAEIDHHASIDQAWSYISLHGLDPKDVASWRSNGFRVGILARQDLPAFFNALPPRDHDDATTWLTVPREMDPEPIIVSPGLASGRQVTFFLPPDTLRTERLPKGRYQFLLTAKELTDTPGMALTLTPHLYYPNLKFYARSPRETALDGRVFKQLALSTVIASDRFLVLAIDMPIKLPTKPKLLTKLPPPEPPPADTQPKPPLIMPDFDPNPEAAPEPPRKAPLTPAPTPEPTQDPTPTPDPAPAPPPPPPAPPEPEPTFPDQLDPTSIQSVPYDPSQELAKTLQQEWKLADLILGVDRFQTPYQAILIFESIPSNQTSDPLPQPTRKK